MTRNNRKLPVEVATFLVDSPDDADAESIRKIDYNKKQDRAWLANHSLWALNNRRIVQTTPILESR